MSQHDMNIANAAGAAVRTDINNALGALVSLSSGSSAPSTTVAYMLWADTTTNQLKRRNAANSGWEILCTLDEALVLSRSSNTILAESDRTKTLIATGSYTQTFTAAATLGDAWTLDVIVDTGVTLTLDPNSSETIDGSTTKSITGPASGRIHCNGTLFRTSGFPPDASDTVKGIVELAVQSEMEAASSNTLAVTPGRLHYHPGVAKVWGRFDTAGNLTSGYNISSITDGGAGLGTVNFTTAFSSASAYASQFNVIDNAGATSITYAMSDAVNPPTASANSWRSMNYNWTGGQDPTVGYMYVAHGDQ